MILRPFISTLALAGLVSFGAACGGNPPPANNSNSSTSSSSSADGGAIYTSYSGNWNDFKLFYTFSAYPGSALYDLGAFTVDSAGNFGVDGMTFNYTVVTGNVDANGTVTATFEGGGCTFTAHCTTYSFCSGSYSFDAGTPCGGLTLFSMDRN